MEDASKHKFDAILVTKLDRVMRSLVQLNITLSNLWRKLICANIREIDFSTPMGKVQMQIIGAIAEWEREIIVQRTKEGQRRTSWEEEEGRHAYRYHRHAPYIRQIMEIRLNGSSLPKTTLLRRKDEIEELISKKSEKVVSI